MSSLLSYCWCDVLGECGSFTWRLSYCEELVGAITGDDGVGFRDKNFLNLF